MNIGLRIKELREEKKVSQEALADYIEVSKSMISLYENGTNVPRSGKIKKIAEFFKITEEEFYTSKTQPNSTNDPEKDRLIQERDALKREVDLLRELVDVLKAKK